MYYETFDDGVFRLLSEGFADNGLTIYLFNALSTIGIAKFLNSIIAWSYWYDMVMCFLLVATAFNMYVGLTSFSGLMKSEEAPSKKIELFSWAFFLFFFTHQVVIWNFTAIALMLAASAVLVLITKIRSHWCWVLYSALLLLVAIGMRQEVGIFALLFFLPLLYCIKGYTWLRVGAVVLGISGLVLASIGLKYSDQKYDTFKETEPYFFSLIDGANTPDGAALSAEDLVLLEKLPYTFAADKEQYDIEFLQKVVELPSTWSAITNWQENSQELGMLLMFTIWGFRVELLLIIGGIITGVALRKRELFKIMLLLQLWAFLLMMATSYLLKSEPNFIRSSYLLISCFSVFTILYWSFIPEWGIGKKVFFVSLLTFLLLAANSKYEFWKYDHELSKNKAEAKYAAMSVLQQEITASSIAFDIASNHLPLAEPFRPNPMKDKQQIFLNIPYINMNEQASLQGKGNGFIDFYDGLHRSNILIVSSPGFTQNMADYLEQVYGRKYSFDRQTIKEEHQQKLDQHSEHILFDFDSTMRYLYLYELNTITE